MSCTWWTSLPIVSNILPIAASRSPFVGLRYASYMKLLKALRENSLTAVDSSAQSGDAWLVAFTPAMRSTTEAGRIPTNCSGSIDNPWPGA